MISERIEDGTRILTAETEEDFAQALDMQGPHDEIEAPIEVLEAFGIQSAESLGLPAEAYERGRIPRTTTQQTASFVNLIFRPPLFVHSSC